MVRASFDEETLAGGARMVAVTGELDMTSVASLRRRLEDAVGDGIPRLIVDLTAVTHMDSSGLAELLTVHQRVASLRGGMALVVSSPRLMRLLQIRGVDGLLTIAGSREEAFAALA